MYSSPVIVVIFVTLFVALGSRTHLQSRCKSRVTCLQAGQGFLYISNQQEKDDAFRQPKKVRTCGLIKVFRRDHAVALKVTAGELCHIENQLSSPREPLHETMGIDVTKIVSPFERDEADADVVDHAGHWRGH